jgi:hypothetical protein
VISELDSVASRESTQIELGNEEMTSGLRNRAPKDEIIAVGI